VRIGPFRLRAIRPDVIVAPRGAVVGIRSDERCGRVEGAGMRSPVDIVWDGALTGRFDASQLRGRLSIDEGEQVQLWVLSRWEEQGSSRAGWKVGLTSGEVRDSFGPGVRPFGFVLRDRVFTSGDTVDLRKVSQPGLETELCFRIGSRLSGPRVDAAEVARSVEAVSAAFEINEVRLDLPQEPGIRVADNLTQWGVVVGEAVSPVPDRAVFESTVSTLARSGEQGQTVAAAGHIDDHFLSIARLAQELAKFGHAIEAGDLVITGSFGRMRGVAGGEYVGTFSGIGEVRASFLV
jgi:2-keto-4-pentenoate hydratase